ncbi:MAG TPA: hypothetical protein PLI05_00820 [Methanotrichaceae archaeon]|nr:hypothetical protein [Methanotrichaceae archaeon]HQF15592.1 hypothetical protein [Methanotrichaceae archaeon]HQI90328.1 hypothetical protein [Methanotrichaceae archaeon]HQJ28571.1 hypothetical protein [Methanotrichaceae archaeon]
MSQDVGRANCFLVAAIALLILTGPAIAGKFDFNPDKYPFVHKHNYQADVEGEGYVMVWQKIDTNNLSLHEYMHGSGTFDEADLISSEQTSSGTSSYWTYDNYKGWVKNLVGASSNISMIKQNEMVYAPVSFSYGTGWYSRNPIQYNSLFKDKTVAKSYQEGAMMHHQIEYAKGYIGDIAVDINCIAATAKADGKGYLGMRIEDDVTAGTLHFGQLMADPRLSKFTGKSGGKKVTAYGHKEAWKNALIEMDANYIGSFHVKKNMNVEFVKYREKSAEDWLPCCSGGFFGIKDSEKIYPGVVGIFDCSCRETAVSSFRPSWNTSMAQYPNDVYRYKP